MDEALPVQVDVADPAGDRIRAWVEGTLGWQVIDHHTASVVPPVCRLVDVGSADAASGATPTILLLDDGDDPRSAVAAAQRVAPAAVLRWPHDRDELPAQAARIAAGQAPSVAAPTELRIAAASGGVGATTVTLAVAGLVAWAGRPVLVVARGPVPVPDVRTFDEDDLAGTGTWRAATAVPGCPALRVVRCRGHVGAAAIDPGPATAVMRDLGPDEDADVLVLRRDRPGLEALEVTSAGTAVVVDQGVVPRKAVTAAAGHRRLVEVPHSVRVARAGALRRVPVSLPGRWLRLLAPIAGDVTGSSTTPRTSSTRISDRSA
ncbi:MAG: hypothetical protein R3343_05595 [Nitriliruptorales bacterium]|nr:hypothetical protein [Nitriliruptorales bacterium]